VSKVYNGIRDSPADCLYAIIDKTKSSLQGSEHADTDKYAGVISLNSTSTVNAVTELGIIVFPSFQRTHVATNAIGLALLWTLDPPSKGGLGLRRVEWLTNSKNMASRSVAEKLGFELEGISRWSRTVAEGKIGVSVVALEKRNGTTGELLGRHSAIYSIVWDEWEEKRQKVVELMDRQRLTTA
jgi:RimJ/RimL family protein N-acetyltransferase